MAKNIIQELTFLARKKFQLKRFLPMKRRSGREAERTGKTDLSLKSLIILSDCAASDLGFRLQFASLARTEFLSEPRPVLLPAVCLDGKVPAAHRSSHLCFFRRSQCDPLVFSLRAAAHEFGAAGFSFEDHERGHQRITP